MVVSTVEKKVISAITCFFTLLYRNVQVKVEKLEHSKLQDYITITKL